MEIKTVVRYIENGIDAITFDTEINAALADGWRLVRREVFPGEQTDLLYAEMAKLSPEEWAEDDQEAPAMTWQEAVRVIKERCERQLKCDRGCPMARWCYGDSVRVISPKYWPDPE